MPRTESKMALSTEEGIIAEVMKRATPLAQTVISDYVKLVTSKEPFKLKDFLVYVPKSFMEFPLAPQLAFTFPLTAKARFLQVLHNHVHRYGNPEVTINTMYEIYTDALLRGDGCFWTRVERPKLSIRAQRDIDTWMMATDLREAARARGIRPITLTKRLAKQRPHVFILEMPKVVPQAFGFKGITVITRPKRDCLSKRIRGRASRWVCLRSEMSMVHSKKTLQIQPLNAKQFAAAMTVQDPVKTRLLEQAPYFGWESWYIDRSAAPMRFLHQLQSYYHSQHESLLLIDYFETIQFAECHIPFGEQAYPAWHKRKKAFDSAPFSDPIEKVGQMSGTNVRVRDFTRHQNTSVDARILDLLREYWLLIGPNDIEASRSQACENIGLDSTYWSRWITKGLEQGYIYRYRWAVPRAATMAYFFALSENREIAHELETRLLAIDRQAYSIQVTLGESPITGRCLTTVALFLHTNWIEPLKDAILGCVKRTQGLDGTFIVHKFGTTYSVLPNLEYDKDKGTWCGVFDNVAVTES